MSQICDIHIYALGVIVFFCRIANFSSCLLIIGVGTHFLVGGAILPKSGVGGYADKGGIVPDDIRLVSCSQLVPRGRQ